MSALVNHHPKCFAQEGAQQVCDKDHHIPGRVSYPVSQAQLHRNHEGNDDGAPGLWTNQCTDLWVRFKNCARDHGEVGRYLTGRSPAPMHSQAANLSREGRAFNDVGHHRTVM